MMSNFKDDKKCKIAKIKKKLNASLNKAAKLKDDEFYTSLETIEDVVPRFRDHFNGKTVYLNCDNPFRSNFFKFFIREFNNYGLKRLIATSYKKENLDIEYQGYMADVRTKPEWLDVHDNSDLINLLSLYGNKLAKLHGDGDYKSDECLGLLNESDIVCTNPPFSIFGSYFETIVASGKRFLIIGPHLSMTRKNVFTFYYDGKFKYHPYTHENFTYADGATKLIPCSWHYNLDYDFDKPMIELCKNTADCDFKFGKATVKPFRYNIENIMVVNRLNEIPIDYYDEIAVPITFVYRKFNYPFDILGYSDPNEHTGKEVFRRIIIKIKKIGLIKNA